MTVSEKYARYLESDLWAIKRAICVQRAGYKCTLCGKKGSLDVHHKTYERIGRELQEDLVALCRPCHDKADHERREAAEPWGGRQFNAWLDAQPWIDQEDHVAVEMAYDRWCLQD